MSSQRPIKDEMWSDSWFYDLDPSEKLVWVFLLTNERQNVAGIYEANIRWICSNTGFDKQVIEQILKRFEDSNKIAVRGGWIVLLNHYKHQSTSPKIEEGIARILKEVPEIVLEIYPIHRVCIRYRTLLNLTKLIIGETGSPQTVNMWNKNKEEKVVDYDSGEIVEPVKPRTKKYPNAPAICKIFQEVLGKNPGNWRVNKTQLLACENLYTERTPAKVRSALEYYKANREEKYCPQISSPYDLDSKWTKLGEFKLKQV